MMWRTWWERLKLCLNIDVWYGLLTTRMGLAATRLSLSHGSTWGRLILVIQLAVLVGGLPARSSDSEPATMVSAAADEPITPIPEPPAADPIKVKLGERLFSDPNLSRDGARACLTCHDTQTNGAKSPGRGVARDGPESALDTLTVFNAALNFRLNWE